MQEKRNSNELAEPWSLQRTSFLLFFMHFCPGTMTTHAKSINSDLQRLRHTTLIIEFLRLQIPTDRTNGIRTRATQMLTNTIVEICSTPLITAPRRPNVRLVCTEYIHTQSPPLNKKQQAYPQVQGPPLP